MGPPTVSVCQVQKGQCCSRATNKVEVATLPGLCCGFQCWGRTGQELWESRLRTSPQDMVVTANGAHLWECGVGQGGCFLVALEVTVPPCVSFVGDECGRHCDDCSPWPTSTHQHPANTPTRQRRGRRHLNRPTRKPGSQWGPSQGTVWDTLCRWGFCFLYHQALGRAALVTQCVGERPGQDLSCIH